VRDFFVEVFVFDGADGSVAVFRDEDQVEDANRTRIGAFLSAGRCRRELVTFKTMM